MHSVPNAEADGESSGDAGDAAVSVETAEQLRNAIDDARDGAEIALGADISYDTTDEHGPMSISKNITIDCNGHALKSSGGDCDANSPNDRLFDVEEAGRLTLVNADLEAGDFRYDDGKTIHPGDIVGINRGVVVVKSTSEAGIRGSNLVCENYGAITFESGSANLGDDLIDSNRGTLTINDGSFNLKCVVDESYGTVEIHSGKFVASGYCFDDVYGELIIHDADVSSERSAIYLADSDEGSGRATIYAGTFVSNGFDVVQNPSGCTVTVYTGSFEETGGDTDGCLCGVGTWIVPEGYAADPADWRESKPSKVRFFALTYTVRFYSEGELVNEQTDFVKNLTFPENPTHSKGCEFLYWEDGNGMPVEDLSALTGDTDLFAVFSDRTYTVAFSDNGQMREEKVRPGTPLGQVPGLDRKEAGDNFRFWKMGNEIVDETTSAPVYADVSLVAVYSGMVATYEELQDAIARKDPVITLGADIPCPGTVSFDYECVLNGNGFGLIRPEGFQGVLLSVECGVTGGEGEAGVETTGTTLTVRNARVDGSHLDAYGSAVSAGEGTTLVMTGATVENNRAVLAGAFPNPSGDSVWYSGLGGGVYAEDATLILTNCIIRDNVAKSGGGIYIGNASDDDTALPADLVGCSITGNEVEDYGGGVYAGHGVQLKLNACTVSDNKAGQDGGGLSCSCGTWSKPRSMAITDTVISGNTASCGGGVDTDTTITHLYGTTSIKGNHATSGGGFYSSSGDEPTSILFMHDDSAISYNEADEKGGGVCCDEILLVMYDDSSIDHNYAKVNGGGVYASDYGMQQHGGVIRDNRADERGGVYVRDDSSLIGGAMFDNTAGKAGDDLFNDNSLKTLYSSQPSRVLGEGDSANLGTVSLKQIAGYKPAPSEGVSVPWYGWFVDGDDYSGNVRGDDGKYHYVEDIRDRYVGVEGSTRVCTENDNLGILSGERTDIGVKAIWYGLLLAYDANFDGSSDYRYDEQAYTPGSNAAAKDGMFSRAGYRFVGWNTEKDGSGISYGAGDAVVMNDSQVLYAQWEALPRTGSFTIGKEVTGTGTPDADASFEFAVTKDGAVAEGSYSVDDGALQPIPADGKIALKAGQTAQLVGLLPGDYVVTEDAPTQANYKDTNFSIDGGAPQAGLSATVAVSASEPMGGWNTGEDGRISQDDDGYFVYTITSDQIAADGTVTVDCDALAEYMEAEMRGYQNWSSRSFKVKFVNETGGPIQYSDYSFDTVNWIPVGGTYAPSGSPSMLDTGEGASSTSAGYGWGEVWQRMYSMLTGQSATAGSLDATGFDGNAVRIAMAPLRCINPAIVSYFNSNPGVGSLTGNSSTDSAQKVTLLQMNALPELIKQGFTFKDWQGEEVTLPADENRTYKDFICAFYGVNSLSELTNAQKYNVLGTGFKGSPAAAYGGQSHITTYYANGAGSFANWCIPSSALEDGTLDYFKTWGFSDARIAQGKVLKSGGQAFGAEDAAAYAYQQDYYLMESDPDILSMAYDYLYERCIRFTLDADTRPISMSADNGSPDAKVGGIKDYLDKTDEASANVFAAMKGDREIADGEAIVLDNIEGGIEVPNAWNQFRAYDFGFQVTFKASALPDSSASVVFVNSYEKRSEPVPPTPDDPDKPQPPAPDDPDKPQPPAPDDPQPPAPDEPSGPDAPQPSEPDAPAGPDGSGGSREPDAPEGDDVAQSFEDGVASLDKTGDDADLTMRIALGACVLTMLAVGAICAWSIRRSERR